MRTTKFRKPALVVKGLYRYMVTNLSDFQKRPPLDMSPVCSQAPPHISMADGKSVEGAEATEIGLSFQESLHI